MLSVRDLHRKPWILQTAVDAFFVSAQSSISCLNVNRFSASASSLELSGAWTSTVAAPEPVVHLSHFGTQNTQFHFRRLGQEQ